MARARWLSWFFSAAGSSALEQLPNVGPAMAGDLQLLGIHEPVPREKVVSVGGYWQPKYSVPNARMVEAVQMAARTEGLLLDAHPNVTDQLTRLGEQGIQVSLDDFGTGYSAMAYLKRLDIDYLKIDRSFVRDLTTDPSDLAITEAIIVMAHKLGLEVIAEGIETEAQRDRLAAAGCDYGQGFLLSHPLPENEFFALLSRQAANLTPP